MYIDHASCTEFYSQYLATLLPTHPHNQVQPEIFGFGNDARLAEELAALVVSGRKRATASLALEHMHDAEPLPAVGDISIIVRGDGSPAALIESVEVTTRPFHEVDAAFAAAEGEGDGSLEHWRRTHQAYFKRVCRDMGSRFDPSAAVVCDVFRVLWPAEIADRMERA